ncbi:signal recognition particle subunit SRP19/SEC65 family protein [Roseomonas sp. CECT 9278]|uniref:signal recognition particle subunit SRP19/SEC65 family protein n=1 Tax=Roseomonas sp. CECT 9278 TaxID=2845823 RepID=UPI001E285989|nr:signal recognition particle subunit SRP19/SEC65 family protein [Roseomonas sp. CECT 9278]CAH0128639.1 hypothetical protein ROS9278_00175 [Roseomonas sp. CECT 9278]
MSARTQRRWIVLGQDGRHVTLGRAVSPTAEEIAAASDALSQQGLAGWIATLEGDYWGRGRVTLAPVQIIGTPVALDWSAAVVAFLDARQRARRAA